MSTSQEAKTVFTIEIHSTEASANPMSIMLHGVLHDPSPLHARWNADSNCLSDTTCFIGSWLDANTNGEVQHILALRYPAERGTLQSRISRDPSLLRNSTSRFQSIKSWELLGWIDYGPFRIALLIYKDQTSKSVYVLPLRMSDADWSQTDSMAVDQRAFTVVELVANEMTRKYLGNPK